MVTGSNPTWDRINLYFTVLLLRWTYKYTLHSFCPHWTCHILMSDIWLTASISNEICRNVFTIYLHKNLTHSPTGPFSVVVELNKWKCSHGSQVVISQTIKILPPQKLRIFRRLLPCTISAYSIISGASVSPTSQIRASTTLLLIVGTKCTFRLLSFVRKK
jgi:hypothetical protein